MKDGYLRDDWPEDNNINSLAKVSIPMGVNCVFVYRERLCRPRDFPKMSGDKFQV